MTLLVLRAQLPQTESLLTGRIPGAGVLLVALVPLQVVGERGLSLPSDPTETTDLIVDLFPVKI